jgi:hypothetical protein
MYAQGLAQASERLQGQPAVTPENAMLLVQSLLGGPTGNAVQDRGLADGDIGSLLGAMLGGGASQSSTQPQAGEDMANALAGMLGGSSQSGQGSMNMGTLMQAGMAFLQARQQGAEPAQALAQAIMAGSGMNTTASHSQSGQLVAETLLSTIGSMLGGKKRTARRR